MLENIILNSLNSNKTFNETSYNFYQIAYIKELTYSNENLGFYSVNSYLNINLSFDFIAHLPDNNGINRIEFTIFNLVKNENFIFGDYIKRKYDDVFSEKMTLKSYLGNGLIEKMENFLLFFEREISQYPIRNILQGVYWTNEFNYNTWGNR